MALVTSALVLAIAGAASHAAALALAAFLALADLAVPALATATSRSSGGRVAAARAYLGAELLEAFAGAPELVA